MVGGEFADVTSEAGIASPGWAVAAGWFDYDRDGLLDLFVVNYLDWEPADERYCGDRDRGLRIYCSPTYWEGLPNTLYRNRGDGTFEDVSVPSGLSRHVGKGMSVAFADFDLDGWIDAFVANDTEPDFLFRNLGNGKFQEAGLLSGVALASDGAPISSMGVDFQDYDNDGLPDIHVTALNRQTFPLFRNLGAGLFDDTTSRSRLHSLTVSKSGWATKFEDFDNDGMKDLFVTTSHVNDLAPEFENAPYRQSNAVFKNGGDGTFEDVSQAAADFPAAAHRGAAFCRLRRRWTRRCGGIGDSQSGTVVAEREWCRPPLAGNSTGRDDEQCGRPRSARPGWQPGAHGQFKFRLRVFLARASAFRARPRAGCAIRAGSLAERYPADRRDHRFRPGCDSHRTGTAGVGAAR